MADDIWNLTLRAQAMAWQCDSMGHVNTRQIQGIFDDATAVYFTTFLGVEPHLAAQTGVGWADRTQRFEFLHELLEGDVVAVETTLVRVGTKSVTVRHRMRNVATKVDVAEAEIVVVCFDLGARAARALPPSLLERASALSAANDGGVLGRGV